MSNDVRKQYNILRLLSEVRTCAAHSASQGGWRFSADRDEILAGDYRYIGAVSERMRIAMTPDVKREIMTAYEQAWNAWLTAHRYELVVGYTGNVVGERRFVRCKDEAGLRRAARRACRKDMWVRMIMDREPLGMLGTV